MTAASLLDHLGRQRQRDPERRGQHLRQPGGHDGQRHLRGDRQRQPERHDGGRHERHQTWGAAIALTTNGSGKTLTVSQDVLSGGGNVTFNTTGAESLGANINAGTGTVWLDPTTGGVNQTAGGMTAANLLVTSGDARRSA